MEQVTYETNICATSRMLVISDLKLQGFQIATQLCLKLFQTIYIDWFLQCDICGISSTNWKVAVSLHAIM